jgi:hypothetical protein
VTKLMGEAVKAVGSDHKTARPPVQVRPERLDGRSSAAPDDGIAPLGPEGLWACSGLVRVLETARTTTELAPSPARRSRDAVRVAPGEPVDHVQEIGNGR